jgi:hypothetical protein
MSAKEYHFGVVATFDEEACHWTYQATYINGDDSPFREMDWGEIYNVDTEDWELAIMRGDTDPSKEAINFTLLTEAIETAQRRLNRPGVCE